MRILILFFLFVNLFALNESQLKVLQNTYKIASKFKAKDGHIFNDTMCAIVLTETSSGKYIIGDNYYSNGKEKHFLLKSLGIGQVKLETAILMIKKYPKIFSDYRYLLHKNQFSYKKYVNYLENIMYFQNIYDRYRNKKHKTKRDIRVIKWSKRELNYYQNKMSKYEKYYYKDMELAQILLSDLDFNIKIGVLYLITNYNYAKSKRMWNPYFKAISRYNGGWKNKKYYKRVMKNMKIIRELKRKGFLWY